MGCIGIVLRVAIMVVEGMLFAIAMIFKLGLYWLAFGYLINYVLIDNPTQLQHIGCMVLAWGGTFLHFFGLKIIMYLRENRKAKELERAMTYEALRKNNFSES